MFNLLRMSFQTPLYFIPQDMLTTDMGLFHVSPPDTQNRFHGHSPSTVFSNVLSHREEVCNLPGKGDHIFGHQVLGTNHLRLPHYTKSRRLFANPDVGA